MLPLISIYLSISNAASVRGLASCQAASAAYSKAAGRVAEAWVGDEQLMVWLTPLDGVQSVIRINVDGSGSTEVIDTHAYWPAVSPDGRYLAYTKPAADGVTGTTMIIDLETLAPLHDGISGSHAVWSSDSKLVAIRGNDVWQVFSVAQDKVISSAPVAAGHWTLLPSFAGDKLTYANLAPNDGAVERMEIRKVETQG